MFKAVATTSGEPVQIGFTMPQAGAVAWQAPRAAGYAREAEQLG
ncbi:hypothetical protein [Lentzea xinjiangensis]|nr:hypothetical protein [Lentzea xinjiangensis]